MSFEHHYDVIVVGGGHAGTEAALAASRVLSRERPEGKVLLLTHNLNTVGQMSCNPAIGGIGKGHLVKEIDALGGVMAKAADRAAIQIRRLNASKGPAVRATRVQADRNLYRAAIFETVEAQANLNCFQQAVEDLIIEQERVTGVVTQMGLVFRAPTVILTVGTFLAGKIHIGLSNQPGGRAGDPPATKLAEKLRERSFVVDRLKTGTPPRIDGRSIDYTKLTAQPGDNPRPVFSFLGTDSDHPRQVPCHITHTNEKTHDLIRAGLSQSPLYTGVIEGVGPRYCPSIEDKVMRFSDKTSHQIFVEPEGLNIFEVYPNGISTSLPYDVQHAFVRSMVGFEHAHITRPGYAIEYDYFDPRGLLSSLETKHVKGLFFAGQINGTTGYEEAAAQGLISGLNAARQVCALEPWTPRRDEAYIGVLIDDLITRGTNEPYRMFTSRAEYRLLLREDNADLRLTEIGRKLGLVDDIRWQVFSEKQTAIIDETARLKKITIQPDSTLGKALADKLTAPLTQAVKALDLLARPEVNYSLLQQSDGFESPVLAAAVIEQIDIQATYQGYIDRQTEEIARQRRHELTSLPKAFDYANVKSLSAEVVEKLNRHQPETIGQASRIPGMTPAAISILLVHLKRQTLMNAI